MRNKFFKIFLICFVVFNIYLGNENVYADTVNLDCEILEVPKIDFSNVEYDEYTENYDYKSKMGIEYKTFISWLIEKGFDFNELTHVRYISDNFNKLILKCISEGKIDNFINPITPMFGIENHARIILDSINILKNDDKIDVYNFFYNNNKFTESLTYISRGSQEPDTDEMHTGNHYYVFGRGGDEGYYKNNALDGLDAEYSISARTRFEEHYTTALSAYKSGKYDIAFNSLGRALHYLL